MDLTPERIEKLQRLFELALDVAASERADFLDRETGHDAALRDEVLALIAAHETRSDPLSRPLDIGRPAAGEVDASRWLGVRAGAWRVTRTIGSGGMGTVCEVERADAQFEKRAAIKFLLGHAR